MISFLRDLILKDWWLKFFSFILATLIYVTVSFVAFDHGTDGTSFAPSSITGDIRTFYNLPVTIMSSAADVRLFRVDPEHVAVTVQGDPRVLTRLQSNDIRVLADLTGIENASDLRKRLELSAPPGVTHTRIVPPEVRVVFPAKR